MSNERKNEELKEGRKVSGSCAEILLTCTFWNLNLRKGMIYERRNEEKGQEQEGGIEKEGENEEIEEKENKERRNN